MARPPCIAVISDTHDHVPVELHTLLRGADAIWHLGDVCERSILEELATIGPPLEVVRGNNDWEMDWPLTRTLACGPLIAHLVHIAPRRAPKGVHLLLHGHTHEPSDETIDGVRFLNPGALNRPRGGSARGFAWLEPRPEGLVWERVNLTRR